MIVHFSRHLDGMRPAPPATAAGEATLGPDHLIEVLEVRLGLAPVLTRPGRALLAYQRCLAECDHEDRFFHRSLDVDALSVARTLLAWRSQWYEHGWSGRFAGPVSKRLSDMAEVETLARERVPLTHGQRLARVLGALDRGLTHGIERIVLHDDAQELPARWRVLLERFNVEMAAGVAPQPRAGAGGDLGRVQRALFERMTGEGGAARPRERLAGDSSFIVVRGISRDLSAQAIAEYLRRTPGAVAETVVIAERDGIIVDNAFQRVGLPRAGFQHYSRFRAVTQVLKRCLALVWEPIDPHLLLQFLIHPVGPLPGHARSELAAAVASEPGVGGTAWRKAIATIAERTRARQEKQEKQEKPEKPEKEIAALTGEIAYWLELERHSPRTGAPLSLLIERAQRCAAWLTGQLHAADKDERAVLYAAAVAQGEALIAALGELQARGDARIHRIALEQLVDEVSGHPPDPAAFAQAGHVRATAEPAAITRAWRCVIWWDLAPHTTATSYPWSDAELAELAREGIELPPVDERIRMRIRGWLRPILNATERLILVIHDRDEGHHPLWTQLRSSFENFTEVRIEDALLVGSGRTTIPALDVPTEPLPLRPLPRSRRWWRLPGDCLIPAPLSESYKSLEQLIYHPHEWVLDRAARLREGRAADLSRDNQLHGNLVHRLIERFFATFPDWARRDERALDAWFAEFVPVLIRQEGALLCWPGHGVARERVVTILENAVMRLLSHLRSAHVESVTVEAPGEAPLEDTRLNGRIDLLLRDGRGREIVLDVKWSGQDYRAADLAANRHIQLATYAYLRHEVMGAWPYLAYYIASTGNVLARDTSLFPYAIAVQSTATEPTDALWARVTRTYAWRRSQIAAGRIEVTAAGTAPDADDPAPPENVLDTNVGPDKFDPFTWVTGWEDGV